MVGIVEHEAVRVRDLVIALEQQEITLKEFSEGVGSLTAEAIQVTGALLGYWTYPQTNDHRQVLAARQVCHQLASRARVLS